MDFYNQIQLFLENSGFNIITVVVVVVLGSAIVKKLLKIVKRTLLESAIDRLLVKFIIAILRIVSYLAILFYCLSILDIPLDGMVGALSAVTLAIGLAVQDIISGVASGLMLVSIHPFGVGDVIEIDGNTGSVKEVNLFHTILMSADGRKIVIPNKTIFSANLINLSSSPTRRIDIDFGVDYDNDIDKVKAMMLKVAKSNSKVLKSPKPAVMLTEVGDSELIFRLRVHVANGDYWGVKFALTEALVRCADEDGVELCYPQLTISNREERKS